MITVTLSLEPANCGGRLLKAAKDKQLPKHLYVNDQVNIPYERCTVFNMVCFTPFMIYLTQYMLLVSQ